MKQTSLTILMCSLLLFNCKNSSNEPDPPTHENENPIAGCDGQIYPALSETHYVLPFAPGETYNTGLTNCSSSYHAFGRPDQYAFDFNMDIGTPFTAARGGTVYALVEKSGMPNPAGLSGNYVIIDHGDGSFGVYLHAPDEGIAVEVGATVKQGDLLGVAGNSGLAGYPHLHFIVVKGSPNWPYSGMPVSFKNASPKDVALKTNSEYKALAY